MPSEARQKKIMEKLNRAQKCSILGPQNLGSRGAPQIRACNFFPWSVADPGFPSHHKGAGENLLLPPTNEVWGKVIFSQASVILLTGWSASVHAGIHPLPGRSLPPRRPPPRRPPSAKETPSKETPCQGDPPPRRPPSKETPLPSRPTPRGEIEGDQVRPTARGEIEGDQIQAHTQGGNSGGSDPGPHPRGKFRGIRSRPTPKGEIQGDQIQAHTQGGNSGGSGPDAPLPHDDYCCGWYASYAFLFARFLPKTAWKWEKLFRGRASLSPSLPPPTPMYPPMTLWKINDLWQNWLFSIVFPLLFSIFFFKSLISASFSSTILLCARRLSSAVFSSFFLLFSHSCNP